VGTFWHNIQGTDRDSGFHLNASAHRYAGRKLWPWLSMGLYHISWVKLWRERTEIFSNTDVSEVLLWLLFVRCSACNKSIESDMCIALPDGIYGRKFRLSQKNLPAFKGHNCPSVHYIRIWNTPVVVVVLVLVVIVTVFVLPLGLHPWVGLDLLTDLQPLLSRLHINSPISAPNSRDVPL